MELIKYDKARWLKVFFLNCSFCPWLFPGLQEYHMLQDARRFSQNYDTCKIFDEFNFFRLINADNFYLVRFLDYFINLAILLSDVAFLKKIQGDYSKKFIDCKKLTIIVNLCKIFEKIGKNKALPCKILKESYANLKRYVFCPIYGSQQDESLGLSPGYS